MVPGYGECGHLAPVNASSCPDNPNLPSCLHVGYGNLCEGDGECGTTGIDNCVAIWDLDSDPYDVYFKSSIPFQSTDSSTNTLSSSAGEHSRLD